MNRLILTGTAMLLAIGATAPAAATSINVKQADQRRLIDAGIRSGSLTPREARTLRAEQNSIEQEKARLKARSGYNKRDQAIIRARQEAAARHIDAAKTNGHRAPGKKVLGAKVF